MPNNEKPRRAITLGGGGPAAGLHIGVLEALAERNITFDVWSLSCIGAWVGIVYNQSDKASDRDKAIETYEFFRDGVFRDDEGYKHFPINRVFGPDWRKNIDAFNEFVWDSKSYTDFQWQPYKLFDCIQETLAIAADHLPRGNQPARKLDEGDFNRWILNQVMAPNPFIRYLASMMYLSRANGLSKINYPDSDFMKKIKFDRLSEPGKPFIFHNAWNLNAHELTFFANRPMRLPIKTNDRVKRSYGGRITAQSLCACSALPFVEETVDIGKITYCEGALVDTVNFEGLLDHRDEQGRRVNEIWISRIVDSQQIRKPKNLHDGLANLCQLFAATVGEDDVKLFKYHVRYDRQKGEVSKGNGSKNRNSNQSKAEPPKAKVSKTKTSGSKTSEPEDPEDNGSEDVWNGTVVEIHVPGHINFKWNHSNLENGRKLGQAAAMQAINQYYNEKDTLHPEEPLFINENPEKDPEWQSVREEYVKLKEALADS
jgi:predicted acylesterase/phospholipase RssA